MIVDCDRRTVQPIEKEVRDGLKEMYGSVFEVPLLEIKHEDVQVAVLGEFTARPSDTVRNVSAPS